jgi:hypothetical protein
MEHVVSTKPHIRNGTYQVIVRNVERNEIVRKFQGPQLMRPKTMQVLNNGHLVIGYSSIRPFYFDYINDEGQVYNKLELDADKCWILKNGLLVEVVGRQTIVKQILPHFKSPRLVQLYNFPVQWVELFEPSGRSDRSGTSDMLIAQRCDTVSLLSLLSLASSTPLDEIPIFITNLVLDTTNHSILYGTTIQSDYVLRIHLDNLYENGFTRTESTALTIPRRKCNLVTLTPINDRYTLFRTDQKSHSRDTGSTSYIYLIDWTKRQSIWSSSQDISIVAVSGASASSVSGASAHFVYCDNESHMYHYMTCGCSVSTPIALLSGLKPKGPSRFMSNGAFVFHGEKRTMVIDIPNSTVLVQYDSNLHGDLMTLSKCDYRPKPKPEELDALAQLEAEAKALETKAAMDSKSEAKQESLPKQELPQPEVMASEVTVIPLDLVMDVPPCAETIVPSIIVTPPEPIAPVVSEVPIVSEVPVVSETPLKSCCDKDADCCKEKDAKCCEKDAKCCDDKGTQTSETVSTKSVELKIGNVVDLKLTNTTDTTTTSQIPTPTTDDKAKPPTPDKPPVEAPVTNQCVIM